MPLTTFRMSINMAHMQCPPRAWQVIAAQKIWWIWKTAWVIMLSRMMAKDRWKGWRDAADDNNPLTKVKNCARTMAKNLRKSQMDRQRDGWPDNTKTKCHHHLPPSAMAAIEIVFNMSLNTTNKHNLQLQITYIFITENWELKNITACPCPKYSVVSITQYS